MGVSHVQEFLTAQSDLNVSLHYVWLPIFPRVAERRALPKQTAQFADAGVTQYWDDAGEFGRELKRRVVRDFDGEIVWDTFILFDDTATWATAADHVLGWGYTIEGHKEKLFTLLTQFTAVPAPADTLEPTHDTPGIPAPPRP